MSTTVTCEVNMEESEEETYYTFDFGFKAEDTKLSFSIDHPREFTSSQWCEFAGALGGNGVESVILNFMRSIKILLGRILI